MYWKQIEATDPILSNQIHDGSGLIRRRNLFGESSRLPIRVEIWELDPGVTEGDHIHQEPRPLEEIYYFLEGEGTMTVEGDEVPVKAGDAIMVPPGANHGILSTGSNPLRFVIIWGAPEEGTN
jgi:mannose-6-phosphate isomerase-like protein (cupin superfamily)